MGLLKSLFGGVDSGKKPQPISAVFLFTTEDLHIDDNPAWTHSDPRFVEFVNDGMNMLLRYVKANPQYSMDTVEASPKPLTARPGVTVEMLRSHFEDLAREEYGNRQFIFHCVGGKFGQPFKGFLAVV